MNAIPGITRSGYTAAPVQYAARTEKVSKNDTDIFTTDIAKEKIPCVERQERISQEQVEVLSQKYDLRNMDRNQFSRLLAELRDSGVITSQEYSTAYAGTLPQGVEQKPILPFGKGKADFLQLIDQCARYCSDIPVSPDNEALTMVYTKLNTVFHQIGQTENTETAEEQSSDTAATEGHPFQGQYSEKIIQLYEQLKAEKNKHSLLSSASTTAQQLAKEILLSDDELLESMAKHLWIERAKDNQECIEAGRPELVFHLPADYTEIADTIKGILTGAIPENSKITLYGVYEGENIMPPMRLIYASLEGFLRTKVRNGERLTEIERQLSPVAAKGESYIWNNFDDHMQEIQDNINSQLGESGFKLDLDKEYQFYLDTATFTFSVKGGSDSENRVIADALNTHPRGNYKFDPLHETLMAMYFSRPNNLSISPWNIGIMPDKLLQEYGIASDISDSYTQKMKQFLSAYSWHEMDQNLKYNFGFGVDDIQWDGEKLVGKNDEVTKLIEKMDEDMMRATGLAYANLRNEYTGTPEFSEPVFVFKNGKFQLTYEKR